MSDEQKDKKFRIVGLGEILWDIYNGEKFIGGSPANFAAHIAHAGQDAYLCSRVGEDEDGDDLLQRLNKLNVNISGVQHDIFKPTGKIKITLDTAGNPEYHCTSDVAFDYMRFDTIWERLAPQMDAVFFGLLAQRTELSRQAIQLFLKNATTALKVCDVNIRSWNSYSPDQ